MAFQIFASQTEQRAAFTGFRIGYRIGNQHPDLT
jgi:hypothetical protein